MSQFEEACNMLDTFASVGVDHFDLTHLDIDGAKRGFRRAQSVGQIKTSLPHLFPSAAARQNNIVIRPASPAEAALVQLDDLKADILEKLDSVALLCVYTSPGNYQAWVAIAGEPDKDLARRLRKGMGADKSASGATRIAGSFNFKRKYEPDFPTVRMVKHARGRIVEPAILESMGLLAAPDAIPEPVLAATRSFRNRAWPDYQKCVRGAPPSLRGPGPDRSLADFVFCQIAVDWGWSPEDAATKLLEVSDKAKERIRLKDEGYPLITAQNAAAAVARRRGR